MFLLIIPIVLVVLLIWAIATYNGLIQKRNRVSNAWSQIDVQLKRRHDLIPNLVNAVKGYLEHERTLLQSITDARSRAIAAGGDVERRAEAENELTRTLRSLFAVAENYPQLRASENVMALQEELSSTENRIAFARQFYNDAVLDFNTAQQQFPSNLVAGSLGFSVAQLYAVDQEAERSVPVVQLS